MKSRRGGFLGSLVNQGIVPLTILGMQQTYRKKHGGKRTRKHRKGRSRRHR
jgi:hypothetical protein